MTGQLNCRVLLVDDEPLLRRLISGYLVAAGYVVRAAVDGLDALQKLRGGIPDLIISALDMPRMSGVELLHIVRQRFPHVPIIAITSGSTPSDLPNGVEADAYCPNGGADFESLLQSASALTQDSSRRAAAPVPKDQSVRARLDGNRHYMIQCQECLRSFSVPRERGTGPHNQWTICVHCGTSVEFICDSLDV